ncbi:hypothetical protein ACJIZ3_000515 [Penstemon smallii]|uniref:Uncharacterized protein n=1 Tax=Penstemon smallii TaxID=265156 RepID=A0ABD3R2G7_9LAMI
MGAIIPALMHRIPSELRTSILEFIGPSLDSGIYWPKPRFWNLLAPFRLRSYHLNN